MAKIYGPLSVRVYGKFSRAIVFQKYKSLVIVRAFPRYSYLRTPQQDILRKKFALGVKRWQAMDLITQYVWRALAYGLEMSGYEYFLSQHMRDRA